jgi:hypothetical protein
MSLFPGGMMNELFSETDCCFGALSLCMVRWYINSPRSPVLNRIYHCTKTLNLPFLFNTSFVNHGCSCSRGRNRWPWSFYNGGDTRGQQALGVRLVEECKLITSVPNLRRTVDFIVRHAAYRYLRRPPKCDCVCRGLYVYRRACGDPQKIPLTPFSRP